MFGRIFATALVSLLIFLFSTDIAIAQDEIGWPSVFDGYSNDHFTGVWGSSAEDIFAVGRYDVGGPGTLVVHYDGNSWEYMNLDASIGSIALQGVWGLDENHVYAFGKGAILQYDGESWSNMFEGYLTTAATFYDLWGASPDDLWAVGSAGIFHYDGERWRVPLEGPLDLRTIWGTSSDNIYAGGFGEPIYHYGGVEWWSEMNIRTQDNPYGLWDVEGIWGSGPDDIYVGNLHFDGSDWTEINGYPDGLQNGLGLWGNGPSDVFSVAWRQVDETNSPIAHFDGTAWRRTSGNSSRYQPNGLPYALNDLWGSDENNMYAVGRGGTVIHGPRFDLHIEIEGNGNGDVSSDEGDIDCGSTCLSSFDRNTVLTLSARPQIDSNFDSWGGACSGNENCNVTIDTATTVSATFSIKQFNLVVQLVGEGFGYVEQSFPNSENPINCGLHCNTTADYGTTVELVAHTGADSFFQGWDGACIGTSVCTITLTSDEEVIAVFNEIQRVYLPLIP